MINEKFEKKTEEIALEFEENIKEYDYVLAIHHTDADGIASGALIKSMLSYLGVPFSMHAFDLNISWNNFLDQLGLKPEKKVGLIFSDLCPDLANLTHLYKRYLHLHIYILDHHLYNHDAINSMNDRIYNCNPTQYNLHGLKEIVGATVNYLFADYIYDKNYQNAWIAAIGISGDTLQHIDQMKSYNRLIISIAEEREQLIVKNGICLFGGQFDRIDRALSLSILPFIPEVKGDRKIAKKILNNLNIPPNTKVEDLTTSQIKFLSERFPEQKITGKYMILPQKKGLLRYGYEHAEVLSLLGHNHAQKAFNMIGRSSITQEAKQLYLSFTQKIVKNLSTFVNMEKIETEHALIVDLTSKIEKDQWSNTGSLASINEIYDNQKMLFIGGITANQYKFSVRCQPTFIQQHNNQGANVVIQKLLNQLQGTGGGHGLAGGIRFSPNQLDILVNNIDSVIEDLN